MVSNPMQRKSRNSFLLGVTVTLIISGIIIAMLLIMLKQKSEELDNERGTKTNVYTISQDVNAGQILTKDMFKLKQVNYDTVPSNATATFDVIDSWFLQTKEGNPLGTDKYGLYLGGSDTIIEVLENTGETFEDSKGNNVANGDYYVYAGGRTEKVKSLDAVIKDEYGMYVIDTQNNDTITRVYQENSTQEFYCYKVAGETSTREKEYLEIKNIPILAKVAMKANTVITPQLIVRSDSIITDDVRKEEFNMITLPIDLMTDDYVDIRLMTPSGQNFIVVSKVQVDIPINDDGTYVPDTIRVDLREDEILAMSSAIVEAYGLKGAKLYVTKYIDPANQQAAMPTYTPNESVTAQIDSNGDGRIDNPNIVAVARDELASRYSEAAKSARNSYLQQQINAEEDYSNNVDEGMVEDIGSSISNRQKYLEMLGYTEEDEEE